MRSIRLCVFIMCVLAVVHVVPVVASDGCDQDENNRIVPTLAMCSTHAYNIGRGTNPSGSDKTFMRDVIALKTTVMMQQMYKQYDYLETMIKRLKTQLEKAILTTSLQAKGADTTTSDVGIGLLTSVEPGGDPNIFVPNVKNCNLETTNLDVANCLSSNLDTINVLSNYGQNIDINLRKQLAHDYKLLNDLYCSGIGKYLDGSILNFDCGVHNNLSKKKEFQMCLETMRRQIRNLVLQNKDLKKAFGNSCSDIKKK